MESFQVWKFPEFSNPTLYPGAGFGGGGSESRGQVPCERNYAIHRGASLFVAGRKSDVPPVGCWCHQHDHRAWGGPRQGGRLVLCQHCHGNRLWLLEGTWGGGEWLAEGLNCCFYDFDVSSVFVCVLCESVWPKDEALVVHRTTSHPVTVCLSLEHCQLFNCTRIIVSYQLHPVDIFLAFSLA